MAKRKKSKKKVKSEVAIELYAIGLFILSIIGIGKFGPVGRFISSISLFFTGTLYLVFLIIILLIGLYGILKREWPDFFSTKMLGFYLFVIGTLTFIHWDYVSTYNGNSAIIFRETINSLVKGFKSIMDTGLVDL